MDGTIETAENLIARMGEAARAAAAELAFARRMFADNDWPVIDVSRRSIEETAAQILRLYHDRETGGAQEGDGSDG